MANSVYPELNDRALGWLKFLWDKATTPDDWSINGRPHEWWDDKSCWPTEPFARFDLNKSTFAIGIMADATPAWREGYTRILSEMIARHTDYWAAIDWLTLLGPDPDRANYPSAVMARFIPPGLVGKYDTAGWTANGIEPWGLQPDPIGSTGNVFFRGFFLAMLSVYSKISGDDTWEKPFPVRGYENEVFTWSHHSIADYTHRQWQTVPEGPHCENTKVWPYCVAYTGLGLQLYDKIFSASTHDVYHEWIGYVKKNYMGVGKSGALEWFALFYDPLVKFMQRFPPMAAMPATWFIVPQSPEFAGYLYEAAMLNCGWNDPKRPIPQQERDDPRVFTFALMLANELGDTVGVARMRDYAENHYGPAFFGEEGDRFGWWFGLDERYPRGQWSAMMMVTEVGGPGSWSNLFNRPNLNKFNEPTLEGVDFPALAIRQAWNDLEHGMLSIRTAPSPSRRGTETNFTVSRIPDPSAVIIRCDGHAFDQWEVIGDNEIRIRTTIDTHTFQIYTGYFSKEQGDEYARNAIRANHKRAGLALAGRPADIRPKVISAPSRNLVSLSAACSCC